MHAADRDLGEALGQAYVDRAFPPRAKPARSKWCTRSKTALSADIQSLDLDVARQPRNKPIVKLKGIEDKIGYPSHWRDYSSVKVVRDSYLNNVAHATSFEFERWVAEDRQAGRSRASGR